MNRDQTGFDEMQASDRRAEHRILIGEIALLAVIALVSFLYSHLVA